MKQVIHRSRSIEKVAVSRCVKEQLEIIERGTHLNRREVFEACIALARMKIGKNKIRKRCSFVDADLARLS